MTLAHVSPLVVCGGEFSFITPMVVQEKENDKEKHLLTLDLKLLIPQVYAKKLCSQRIPEPSCKRKETIEIYILLTSRCGDGKIMYKNKKVESVRLDLTNIGQSNLYETRYKATQVSNM